MSSFAKTSAVGLVLLSVVPTEVGASLSTFPQRHLLGPSLVFGAPTLAPMAHVLFCLKDRTRCEAPEETFQPVVLTSEKWLELHRVNRQVNGAIRPQVASLDEWLIAPAKGDCNDYAVTKQQRLVAAGWDPRALLLAEVLTADKQHHLVVVVRTQSGDFVLDNLSGQVTHWSRLSYRWLRVQSPENPRFWTHAHKGPALTS